MKINTAIAVLLFAFSLTACQSSGPQYTPTATNNIDSTPAFTPELTLTHTPEITPTLSATQTNTPFPTATVGPHDLAITTQNAHQIVQLDQFGKKHPNYVDWSPDGRIIAVASGTDITLYDSETLEIVNIIYLNSWNRPIAFSPNSN